MKNQKNIKTQNQIDSLNELNNAQSLRIKALKENAKSVTNFVEKLIKNNQQATIDDLNFIFRRLNGE